MKKITVRRMAEECGFSVLAGADALDREADRVFCCDLLSFVMGRAPADSAWVTVMGNVNAVAVAGLVLRIVQGRLCSSGLSLLAKRPNEISKSIILAIMVEFYSILALLASFLMINSF